MSNRELILSPTQAEEWIRCKRLWAFLRVWRLPTIQKGHFEFGTVLHEVIERWLLADETGRINGLPVDLFPEGWEGDLNPASANLIKYLVQTGIEQGVIERWPGRRIEYTFKYFLSNYKNFKISVTGKIDILLPGAVMDNKSTKSFKYAKSPKALKTNVQVLTYGLVPLFEAERLGAPAPQEIRVRHNTFCKEPKIPKKDLAAIQQGKLNVKVDPAKVVKLPPPETTVSQQDIINNAAYLVHIGREMIDLRLWIEEKKPVWREVPGPEDASKACNMYGGCDFRSICGGREILRSYNQRVRRIADKTVESKRQKAHVKETQNMSSFQEAMRKLAEQKAAVAAASVSATDSVASGVTALPAAAAQMPAATTLQVAVDPAPWANPECKACGSGPHPGFNTKGEACRICDGKDPKSGWFVWERQQDGTLLWEVQADFLAQFEALQAPQTVAQPAATVQPPVQPAAAPAAFPAPAQAVVPEAAPAAEPAEKKAKKGRPKATFTLIIGGAGITKLPPTKKIINLADVLAKWGTAYAQQTGAENYFSADAFGRRDALASVAPQIAEELGSDFVVADGDSPDLRSLVDALKPFAWIVIGS